MFNPGYANETSHRDEEFINRLEEIKRRLKKDFDLEEFDLLFIPCSSTLAMEMIISDIKANIVVTEKEGKFNSRWRELVKIYDKNLNNNTFTLGTRFETSIGALDKTNYDIVDCVSAFPYYPIQQEKIFLTTTGKQLGCDPLSIVGIKKEMWEFFGNNKGFMSLSKHKDNIPYTYPVNVFDDLLYFGTKHYFNTYIKLNIVENSRRLVKAINKKNIIGEKLSPCLVVKKEAIPLTIAKKYKLYGLTTDSPFYYIFTYSPNEKDVDDFIIDMENSNDTSSR